MKSFYDKPYAILTVKKLGRLLFKLEIISNYWIDTSDGGRVTSIVKWRKEEV